MQELRAQSEHLSQEVQNQREFVSTLQTEKAAFAESSAARYAALERSRSPGATHISILHV